MMDVCEKARRFNSSLSSAKTSTHSPHRGTWICYVFHGSMLLKKEKINQKRLRMNQSSRSCTCQLLVIMWEDKGDFKTSHLPTQLRQSRVGWGEELGERWEVGGCQ